MYRANGNNDDVEAGTNIVEAFGPAAVVVRLGAAARSGGVEV